MKQIPIIASKKDSVKPIIGGVEVSCSLCAAIGKSRTTNQAYIYVMVIEDEDNRTNEAKGQTGNT